MSSWIKSPVVIAALVLFVVGSAVAIVTGVSSGSGSKSKNKPATAAVTSGNSVQGSGTQGLGLLFFAPMLTSRAGTAPRQGPADADSLRSGAVGAQTSPAQEGSYNGAPFTLTGPTVSKSQETVSVTISFCGKVVRDLGYEPGDAVTILCSDDLQSSVKLAVGDWVEVMGITIRGQLAASRLTKIPAHYGY